MDGFSSPDREVLRERSQLYLVGYRESRQHDDPHDEATSHIRAVLMAMDETMAAARRDAVYGWLDRVEGVASMADQRSLAALARTEVVRLCRTTREVLAAHEGDADGRCPQCSGWFRATAFPCSVWTIAHECLIVAGPTAGNRAAGGAGERRPRHAW